jgi:hypothetical protein
MSNDRSPSRPPPTPRPDPEPAGGPASGARPGTARRRPAVPSRPAWFTYAFGHNLEIYLTAALSLVLGLLGIFDLVDTRVVTAATLGTLALLAISNLGSRHQIDELRTSVRSLAATVGDTMRADVAADRYLAVKAPPLDDELRAADDIGLVGVTLSRTVRELAGTLERRLRAGATLRVVVIDPDSAAPLDAVARTLGITSPDLYRPRIAATIEILNHLASRSGGAGRIEVRLLPFVPAFGMYLIDPREWDGRVFVELYQHRSLEPNPCFALRSERDRHWYTFFVNQFDVLWDSARPYPDDRPVPVEAAD